MTVAEALERVRDALAECSFFPKTNETYYPASWAYGEGAGDASTSDHYDVRKSRAAEHVLEELADEQDVTLPKLGEVWEDMGTRDIARMIAAAINEAVAEDDEDAEDEEDMEA